jgi:prefoldin subunit 2
MDIAPFPFSFLEMTSASTSQPQTTTERLTEREIVNQFNAKRSDLQRLATKVTELETDADEHLLVIENLKSMESGRKCFRLMNGVLVERVVGEVLPELVENVKQVG